MGLHAHLTVKHDTYVMDSTSEYSVTFIYVDVGNVNLVALLSSSNYCDLFIIELQHTIHCFILMIHLWILLTATSALSWSRG